jgi:hypothetical protein
MALRRTSRSAKSRRVAATFALVPKPEERPKVAGRKDPVTPEVADFVFRRDKGCIAHELGLVHLCLDKMGHEHGRYDRERLTLEHVHDGGGRMGVRPKSDPDHLVVLCALAAGLLGGNWNTSHKDTLRGYLLTHRAGGKPVDESRG